MLHRSPPARRRNTLHHRDANSAAARKREAMRRWRRNAREGKRMVPVAVDAAILDWLQRHYPGQFNPNDLASVGTLIGKILEVSAGDG